MLILSDKDLRSRLSITIRTENIIDRWHLLTLDRKLHKKQSIVLEIKAKNDLSENDVFSQA